MKKTFLFILLAAIAAASCNEPKKETASMAGAYKNVFYSYASATEDTTITDMQQYKMYTDKHFIFANLAPDSMVGFGFGSYALDGATITEHSIYTSRGLDTAADFTLDVQREPGGYTQLIPEIIMGGVPYRLTEKYTTLPATGTSPLDGAWELTQAVRVTGADTTTMRYKQYKVYQGGHFMFIQRYPADSTGTAFYNGFGFGTFTMDGNTVTETNTLSNYAFMVGVPVRVMVSMNGMDEYVQQIVDTATKSPTLEYYKRVK